MKDLDIYYIRMSEGLSLALWACEHIPNSGELQVILKSLIGECEKYFKDKK